MPGHPSLLVVNGGSSSIKFALFDAAHADNRLLHGAIERIGTADSFLRAAGPGRTDERIPLPANDPAQAATALLEWLEQEGELAAVTGIGHRIVHGGLTLFDPQLLTPTVLTELKAAVPFDPSHLPIEIQLIEALTRKLPSVPQVACFDTAFHKNLPTVAAQLPIPRRFLNAGIRRLGFHGLSYEYLLGELERLGAARGKVILAHLGSGASLAAVLNGQCIDTTMGFTPLGGIMMGTRPGDLDPGLLVYLQRIDALSPDALERLLIHDCGLKGISETSADVRELTARQDTDLRAKEALNLFAYSVRKGIGQMAAALNGVDALVFSGGIGENSAEVRTLVCAGLGFLGIALSSPANASNAAMISTGAVQVRVIPTDEEALIARTALRILKGSHA